MKFRDWVNNNSAVVTIVAVVVLILSLGFIIMNAGGRGYTVRIVDVYFYDTGTGDLFVAKSDQVPPIDAPSGKNKGVRAYVFTCGECKEGEMLVGWLEMYSPQAKAQLENPQPPEENMDSPDYYDVWERGHLVRSMQRDAWVQANSEQGYMVQESIQNMCGEGTAPTPCYPGKS